MQENLINQCSCLYEHTESIDIIKDILYQAVNTSFGGKV